MKIYLEKRDGKTHLAFTLIDVMVGIGVLGIVLVALFASFSFGFTVVKLSREELKATQILQEKTEALRLYNWVQLNNPEFVPKTFQEPLQKGEPAYFNGTISIEPVSFTETDYSDDLRKVTVAVSWTNSTKRTRSTSTFVSRHGLQNYVFNFE